MTNSLSPLARDAKSWPFELARLLLARVVATRLPDGADRDLAMTLIQSGHAQEAVTR